MGVFLRWGILGILSVAALLYAYNASKRMAERHERQSVSAPTAREEADEAEDADESGALPDSAPARALSPHCEVEMLVARRAMEMRRQDAPLDRVLRMQEIAWQEPAARRERLAQVATQWYGHEGPLSADELRTAVVSDCDQSAPGP